MNDKVDETAEVKATEEAAGRVSGETAVAEAASSDAGETGAAEAASSDTGETGAVEVASSDAGEQSGPAGITGADERRRGGGRSWLTTLLLFLLLAATAGAAGYLYFDINAGRKTNEAKLQSLAAGMDALQQGHAALTENIRSLNERLAGTDEQLSGALRELNSLYRLRNSDLGWQLEELKFLLQIASHRLALARDTHTAQAILQSVDARLGGIADPALIPVREQMVADMNRLRTARGADVTGVALALGELAGRADRLPLNPGAAGAPPPAPPDPEPAGTDNRWQRLAGSLWQEMKTLVVISRTDKNTAALLAPRERFFLYQNLRLQLETARLALLLGDEGQFRFSINACTDWLNEYFDSGDRRVRDALASLERAGSVNLREAVPSIDATLRAFDEYLAAQSATRTGAGAQP